MKLKSILAFVGVVPLLLLGISFLQDEFKSSQGGKRVISGMAVEELPKDFHFSLELDSGALVEVSYPPFLTTTETGEFEDFPRRPEVVSITHKTWLWKLPKYNDSIFDEAEKKIDTYLKSYNIQPK